MWLESREEKLPWENDLYKLTFCHWKWVKLKIKGVGNLLWKKKKRKWDVLWEIDWREAFPLLIMIRQEGRGGGEWRVSGEGRRERLWGNEIEEYEFNCMFYFSFQCEAMWLSKPYNLNKLYLINSCQIKTIFFL